MKNLTFTILTLLVFYSFSNAAIVYTDLNHHVINTNILRIDLDKDGTDDIVAANWSNFSDGLAYSEFNFLHTNIEIIGSPIPNRTYDGASNVLDLNDLINSLQPYVSSLTVDNSNGSIAFKNDGDKDYTPWIGQTEKYVGFRIKKNNLYHYGWIKLSFSNDYVLTIHGHAYEDVANTDIKAGDMGGSSNSAPTDIALSNNSIVEGEASGSNIGTLSATDQDANDSHTFSLVAGTGDDDNASFTIDNKNLKSDEIFDFETKSSYSIRVKTDDGNGGTFEKQFTITINDVNDAPSDIALSNNSIDEGEASGSTIGTLSATDQDANDSHTFSLVAGTGDNNNASFTIDNNNLKSNEIFDYETKSSYTIRIKADDGNGGTYEQQLDININDISNVSSDLITKQAIQVFPNPASSTLHVQGIRPNSSLQLVSSIGTIVYEEKNNSSDTVVNISELPTGVYWLNVSNSISNTIITRMITIE